MNVLFVYSHGVRPTQGGTERVIYLVSRALRNLGHQVYFLSLYGSVDDLDSRYNVEAPDKDDARIADFMCDVCERWGIEAVVNEIGEFCNYDIYSRIRRNKGILLISCIHFDVLGPMKYFCSDRYSRYEIRSFRACFSWLKYKWSVWRNRCQFVKGRKQVLRRMLSVSDCVVVPSEPLLHQLRQFNKKACRIDCIHNPNFVKKNETIWPAAKRKMALYVGRLDRQKHVERIVEAWHRVREEARDWTLIIAGAGEMESELRCQINDLQLSNVKMVGHVQDVQELYRLSTLALLASDHESFSLFLMESLSYGCYPIVYDFPAAETLIRCPEWGTRVRKHSVACFAESLRSAICEQRTNKLFFGDIVQYLEGFSPDVIGREWDRLLSALRQKSRVNEVEVSCLSLSRR